SGPLERPVVVSDPEERVTWAALAGWLRRAQDVGLPLRWVGGPRSAWELAGDLETALLIDGPYGLGPLTAAELEPWAARKLGEEGPPSAASVPDADRPGLIEVTGGLLPVLELFREWLLTTYGHFPDPLRVQHAEGYREALEKSAAATERAAA